jgi:hypothetical protein
MPDYLVLKLSPAAGSIVVEDPASAPPGSEGRVAGSIADDWEPVLIALDAESEAAAVELATATASGIYKVVEWPAAKEFHATIPAPEIGEENVARLPKPEAEPEAA